MTDLDQFIQTHHARLVGMAMRAGLSLADAEDCAQAMWLYLHRKGTLSVRIPLAHLTTTMHGRMLDHWRSLRRRTGRGVQVNAEDCAHELVCPERTPDAAHDLKVLRRALRRVGACERDATQSGGAARVKYFRQRRQWAARLEPLQHLIAA
jgi:DNA-directed RNA polymerase specialized sigma24 family protein